MDQIQELFQEKIATILSITLGLIGILVTYKYSYKEKVPKYAIRNITLVSGSFPDLEVHYKGHGPDIPNFSVAYIAFWNAGKETIDKKDIVELGIKIKEGSVFLDTTVIQMNKPETKFRCSMSKDKNYISLTFDYLDYNQGAVIEILHTSTSIRDIQLTGTIKGAFKPPKRYILGKHDPFYYRNPNLTNKEIIEMNKQAAKALYPIGFIIGISVILFGFFILLSSNKPDANLSSGAFLLLGVMLITGLFFARRGFVPKGLDKFEDIF